jgi:heme a synthase
LGGIVRASGSGLGCPDWPKCFGQWVPPTNVNQLPADYKTRYAEDGLPPSKVEFHPIRTWIEYLNRLFGALTGLFILGTTLFALLARGLRSKVFLLSVAGLLLTLVQGYIGAKVVSTALAPVLVTLHNLLAQIIVYILLAAYLISRAKVQIARPSLNERNLALFAWALVIIQFYLGLFVRQQVDYALQAGVGEPLVVEYIQSEGILYAIHRSFSWIVAAVIIWQAITYLRVRSKVSGSQVRSDEGMFLSKLAIGGVIANIALGIVFNGYGIKAWAQPLHLLLASLLLGIFFALFMLSLNARNSTLQPIN